MNFFFFEYFESNYFQSLHGRNILLRIASRNQQIIDSAKYAKLLVGMHATHLPIPYACASDRRAYHSRPLTYPPLPLTFCHPLRALTLFALLAFRRKARVLRAGHIGGRYCPPSPVARRVPAPFPCSPQCPALPVGYPIGGRYCPPVGYLPPMGYPTGRATGEGGSKRAGREGQG